MKKDVKILLISIFFGLTFLVADTYVVHLLFSHNILPFSMEQKETFYDVYVRSFVFLVFLLFGMTVSKMARKCQYAESELLSQLRFENLVAEISSNFIGKKSEHIDDAIEQSLKKIADFADADRSYLTLLSSEPEETDTVYQWHTNNMDNRKIYYYPGRDFPWWMEKMASPEIVHIPDTSKLPASASKEKSVLQQESIGSVLSIPLQSDGEMIGFLGFDTIGRKKQWSQNYVKLMRVVGDLFIDSIERKKAEESILKHRERLARAQEISRVGSWEIDLRTKKHFWSEEMYRIMGYAPSEVNISRDTYLERMHPEDRDVFNSAVELALTIPGYKFDVRARLIRKNGRICILHSLGEVTWDSEGRRVLFRGTTQDITEISLAQEDLQRKNRNLLILQSTAMIAATSVEMQDFLREILKEINSYVDCSTGSVYLFNSIENKFILCSATGFRDEITKKLDCLQENDPLFQIIPYMKDTWITGKVSEIKGCLRDIIISENIGKLVYVPIIAREELVGFILLLPDKDTIISKSDLNILGNVGHQIGITVENIRLLNETRKAYEELKSLDRMKDEFVANITHELKTPLISIKGYSEVIYEGLLGDLEEKQKQCMKVIVSNSERLERLIESLLNMNSLYFEKYHVLSPIHLKDVLDNSINSLSLKIEDNDVNVVKEYPSDMHLVYGNGEFLKYLFVYILDNAIKFSAKGSEITINALEGDKDVQITVTDHGIGIPGACMDRIFDRFYQVDGSATRIHGGNGLGLYLAKNIVELHSGTIEVESEEGVGTTVHLSLPLFNPEIHDTE
ncbi:ATP-binding protein [Methanolobus bombayensis]|uniref:ATP-binding protein n=1 Tax=Methanolobus bombayensis TaxID=38023 RepID=UPI001AE3974C|nr:ATP-binding protein [Methanolobus bombayensis]MBP1910179.1 PAS domain S-box-containing protein [Methanolobus bombayensis]